MTALESTKFIVRMAPEQHAEIKATAKANKRSMNAEILHRLSGTPQDATAQVMAAMHNKWFIDSDGTRMEVIIKPFVFDNVDR